MSLVSSVCGAQKNKILTNQREKKIKNKRNQKLDIKGEKVDSAVQYDMK